MPIVALTVLTYLSGYYVWLSESWDLLYKCNLFFHPFIGTLWAVMILRRLWSGGTALRGLGQGLFNGILVIFIIGVLASAITKNTGWFFLAVVSSAIVAILAVVRKPRGIGLQFAGMSDLLRVAFLYVILFLSASGALILLMRLGLKMLPVFTLHAMAGTGLLLLMVCMVLYGRFQSAGTVGDILLTGTGVKAAPLKRELAILAAVTMICVVVWVADTKEQEARYTFHLSTIPLEKRTPEQVDEIPVDFQYASLMASVETCGAPRGCHAGIVEDHQRSSHNRSIQTSYFQKNLEFLADEIGEHNTYICAGCHFPNAFFLKGTGFRDYADRDGYSCLFCHTVDEVVFTEKKGQTIMRLKPNVKHLKMFSTAGANNNLKPLDELMIQLNPRGHGRVFRKDFYFEDSYCQVCHDLQIKPSEVPGFMKANCINCHMQARKWMGKEGKERNHFFPGTNLAGPADLGDPEAIQINTMYSRGELELPLQGWGGIWSLVPKEERKIKDIWLLVSFEPLDKPVPGEEFRYRLLTTNTSLDHAFPAAPLDLIEVWLETRVKDAQGKLVFQSGVLDENHRLPEGTHKLGGYMLGLDDHLVTKNRVWQIKKKVIEREILVNQQVQDLFSFTLPEHVEGPLEIYASWNYRKLNQEFVDWAYDNSGMTVPILRVAEIEHTVDLAEKKDTVALRKATHSSTAD